MIERKVRKSVWLQLYATTNVIVGMVELTDDGRAFGKLLHGADIGFSISYVSLWVSSEAVEIEPRMHIYQSPHLTFLHNPACAHSRSIHLIPLPDILFQMFPNLRKLATAGSYHAQFPQFPSSSKIETGETDDTDTFVGFGSTGTSPSGGVLEKTEVETSEYGRTTVRDIKELAQTHLSGTTCMAR